mgnify:FL=1
MGNLFSSDLLLLAPSFFLIFSLVFIIVYAVFSSYSKGMVGDVIMKVCFSLFLFCFLLLNQVSLEWQSFNFYFS